MARRSRQHRKSIPGYPEFRPDPVERARDHRRVRHATHQLLGSVVDPDELSPLPEVKRSRADEGPSEREPERRRFRVWKTKFWKRRDRYAETKAALDARWHLIAQPEEEW